MITSLKFLLLMWISESFLFTDVFWPFPSQFFRIFANQPFFNCADTLCLGLTVLLLFFVIKTCVVWWLCGVGSSLCGFLIYLIFTYEIIVGVSVDLCVWFCQNLVWKFFCLFFLHVNKWVVWHFSNCFQRTSSRRMRFGTTCHYVPFVQYNSN